MIENNVIFNEGKQSEFVVEDIVPPVFNEDHFLHLAETHLRELKFRYITQREELESIKYIREKFDSYPDTMLGDLLNYEDIDSEISLRLKELSLWEDDGGRGEVYFPKNKK